MSLYELIEANSEICTYVYITAHYVKYSNIDKYMNLLDI